MARVATMSSPCAQPFRLRTRWERATFAGAGVTATPATGPAVAVMGGSLLPSGDDAPVDQGEQGHDREDSVGDGRAVAEVVVGEGLLVEVQHHGQPGLPRATAVGVDRGVGRE